MHGSIKRLTRSPYLIYVFYLQGTPLPNALSRQHSGPSPRTWTPEQLHAWLHANECGEAVRAFRDQGIDGPAMAGLLRVAGGGEAGRLYELLGGDVGVQHVGLRLRLVDSIMLHFGGSGAGGL
jgi:hypothetical protein